MQKIPLKLATENVKVLWRKRQGHGKDSAEGLGEIEKIFHFFHYEILKNDNELRMVME